jgi:hypothetical protein
LIAGCIQRNCAILKADNSAYRTAAPDQYRAGPRSLFDVVGR